METKLKKWEEQYMNYNEEEENKRIEELENKLENRTINDEEYKELNKARRLRENISKVRNILELREKLKEDVKLIKDELKRRDELEKASKGNEKLDAEMDKINSDIEKATEILKNKNLSDEDRKRVSDRLNSLIEQRDQNNEKFSKNQKTLLDNKEGQFSELSKEDLEKQSFELGEKISKCNLAANNLMKGLSWDSIVVKFDKWKDRTFTSKEKLTELARRNDSKDNIKLEDKNKAEAEVETEAKVKEQIKAVVEEFLAEGQTQSSENSLVPQSTFAEKHPRLAKIGNFFKNAWDKVFKREGNKNVVADKKENKDAKLDKEEKSNMDEKQQEEVFTSERDNFVEYLKVVSEKGLEQIEQERKEQKLRDAKLKAHARETEKFGKEYADRSVNIEDDGMEL